MGPGQNEVVITIRSKNDTRAGNKAAEEEAKRSGQRAGNSWSAGFVASAGRVSMGALLSPSLIPIAGELSAAVAAIGVSFGAAAAGAGGFGIIAGSVLSQASKDAQKLSQLNLRLNSATTASAKKAIRDQIQALEQGWTPAYRKIINDLDSMKTKWKATTIAIASPALLPWLTSVNKAISFLKPALQPVADLFQFWGNSVKLYFTSSDGAANINKMATAFGKFSAAQLKDIGIAIDNFGHGIFILAGYLVKDNVNFGTFGDHLKSWSDSFIKWSTSKQARQDVNKLLAWVRANGPLVAGVLKNLGGSLKTMAPGLTSAGILELQTISSFLGLVAKLPPDVSTKLIKIAGALLLLNKIGVVKIGFKIVGLSGANAAAAGGAAAIGAGIILKIREDLKSGFKGIIADIPHWFSFGSLGFIAQAASGWADNIVQKIRHPVMAGMDKVRHNIADTWDKVRHDASSKWDGIRAAVANKVGDLRNATVAKVNETKNRVASLWDATWRNTVSRAATGVRNTMNWVGQLPGRVRNAFFGASHWLTSFGRNAIQGFWNGMSVIWNKVRGWISSLAGWIKGHKGPLSVDLNLLKPAGEALMKGLHFGMLKGFGGVAGFVTGLASTLGGLVTTNLGSLFGGGGKVGSGTARWAPLVAQVLKMEGLPLSLAGRVLYQMQTESGGNPNAINLTDVNARNGDPSRGLLQTIMTTFLGYHWPGTSFDIFNPLANVAAAVNYARHRYGPTLMRGGMGMGSGHGYASGGIGGGWAMVGERGREMIRLPHGSTVYSNSDTERRLSGVNPGGPISLSVSGGASEFERFLVKLIRRFVKVNYGGNVQNALGN